MTITIPDTVIAAIIGGIVTATILLIIGMYGARQDQERQEDRK